MEFGKLSPLYVECKDGKPTLEQLGISEEDKNLLVKLFNNEEKFPFLEKVFDSNVSESKYKVKLFLINYNEFGEI